MTREAFEQQVLELRRVLYYVSYSLLGNHADQEDAVQECIHKALRKRETLKNDGYLKTWITRILINECHNVLRKRKREELTDEVYISAPPDAEHGLYEAVSMLEERLRVPVVLHYMEGYSIKEISHVLRAPESTIKSRLKRARELLKQALDLDMEGNHEQ